MLTRKIKSHQTDEEHAIDKNVQADVNTSQNQNYISDGQGTQEEESHERQAQRKRSKTAKDQNDNRRPCNAKLLKPGDKIYFRCKAKVKYTNYRNFVNLKTKSKDGVNLDAVDWFKEDDAASKSIWLAQAVGYDVLAQNFTFADSSEYALAKEKEYDNCKKFNVVEEVDRKNYPNNLTRNKKDMKLFTQPV